MRTITFRADGNSKIGLGHVMRSLSLADMLKEDFHIRFMIQEPSELLVSTIKTVTHDITVLPMSNDYITDAIQFTSHIQENDIIVTDGYHFDLSYQKKIKEKNAKLVCIDDLHKGEYAADAIINHAVGITRDQYNISIYTRLLLGAEYTLLRKNFRNAAKTTRIPKNISSVFICFGGSDIENLTEKILEAIMAIPTIMEVHIVTGSAYIHTQSLQQKIAALLGKKTVHTYSNLDSDVLIQIMQKSDLAIVPASGICLEVMTVGMPLITGYYADNQKDIATGCEKMNCGYSIHSFLDKSIANLSEQIKEYIHKDIWKEHITNQKKIFTGNSASLLINLFKELNAEQSLTFRRAAQEDSITYLNWANDPDVRANAIQTVSISLENHTKWFSNKIHSATSYLYYFQYEGKPFGQVRFDYHDQQEYVIDYSIDKNFRSMGLGKVMLRMSLEALSTDVAGKKKISALVKTTNIASEKTFRYLSFSQAGNKTIENEVYIQFIKEGN